MRKILLVITSILIVIAGLSSCSDVSKSSSQSEEENVDLYIVAENICFKEGLNYEDKTVLENTDFVGFTYNFGENQKDVYSINFKLTSDGQKKMTEVSEKLAETSGYLSLWIGDEFISSPKIMEAIIGDEFIITMPNLDQNSIDDFIDKLKSIE